jgi:hypothetical protein
MKGQRGGDRCLDALYKEIGTLKFKLWIAYFHCYVDLRDNSFTIENNNIKATISIEVLDIY